MQAGLVTLYSQCLPLLIISELLLVLQQKSKIKVVMVAVILICCQIHVVHEQIERYTCNYISS